MKSPVDVKVSDGEALRVLQHRQARAGEGQR